MEGWGHGLLSATSKGYCVVVWVRGLLENLEESQVPGVRGGLGEGLHGLLWLEIIMKFNY